MNGLKKCMKETTTLLSIVELLKVKNLSFYKIWEFLPLFKGKKKKKEPFITGEQFRRQN